LMAVISEATSIAVVRDGRIDIQESSILQAGDVITSPLET